jgi:hypothetical protein
MLPCKTNSFCHVHICIAVMSAYLVHNGRWELRTSYPQQSLPELYSKCESSSNDREEQATPTLRSLGLQNAVLIVQPL